MKIEVQDLEKINQNLEEMGEVLEPIKVVSAFNSQLMVLDYRLNKEPKSVSILDYTILEALKKQLPVKPFIGERDYYCPICKTRRSIIQKHNYCHDCGQRLKWED